MPSKIDVRHRKENKIMRVHIATPTSARTGKRIRRLRLEMGLSQKKLGVAANLSGNHISSVERGIENISPEARERVAKALNTTDKYLRTGRKADK